MSNITIPPMKVVGVIHEAAHIVAARVLGFGGAEVEQLRHRELFCRRGCNSTVRYSEGATDLRRYIALLSAGRSAEIMLLAGLTSPSLNDPDDNPDPVHIAELHPLFRAAWRQQTEALTELGSTIEHPQTMGANWWLSGHLDDHDELVQAALDQDYVEENEEHNPDFREIIRISRLLGVQGDAGAFDALVYPLDEAIHEMLKVQWATVEQIAAHILRTGHSLSADAISQIISRAKAS